MKVHPLNFEKVFDGIERKTWSELREWKNVPVKQPIKMVIVMVIHYFYSVLEHGLPPSLTLNHNTYSTLPRIHVRRESMARGTKEHFNFARA